MLPYVVKNLSDIREVCQILSLNSAPEVKKLDIDAIRINSEYTGSEI